jgi:hypothetical protein
VKSKQLSNISTKLPKCPPLFVDRSFGAKKLVAALRKLGFKTKAHDTVFKKTAKDENWLPVVGEKNWRVLTSDQEMEGLHHEAIVEGNVGVFILGDIKKGETYERWVEMVQGCQEQIRHACSRSKRPFVGRISRGGKLWRVRHLKPHKQFEDITKETALDATVFGIEITED